MAHPIYRFDEILRELRKGARLTVLGAAEATEYGNNERWESGVTRVGAQHLEGIAEASAVEDVRCSSTPGSSTASHRCRSRAPSTWRR